MMKALRNGVIALMTLTAAASCGGNTNTEKQEERVVEEHDSVTGITTLRDYTIKDTVTINGRTYRYTCSLEHVDTMPTLINSQGSEYKESRVVINVRRDSTTIFKRAFYKKDFPDIVPSDLAKVSTVVGINYNFLKNDDHTALHFIITIGDPDETSDMSLPIELTIAPDGSSTAKKAENMETAPMSNDLNVDPSI